MEYKKVIEEHKFVHSEFVVYCQHCGYVCYVYDSSFERNEKRQKDIPETCWGIQLTNKNEVIFGGGDKTRSYQF